MSPTLNDYNKLLSELIARRELLQRRAKVFAPLVDETLREIAARDALIVRVKRLIAETAKQN